MKATVLASLGLITSWAVAVSSGLLVAEWFPPSLEWPHLADVTGVPWTSERDFHTSTPPMIAAVVLAFVAATFAEPAKVLSLRVAHALGYVTCSAFQVLVALDTLVIGAPEWAAHALSLIFTRGTKEIATTALPTWPWPSLTALAMALVVLGASSRRANYPKAIGDGPPQPTI